jgi:hypothetical protein
MMLALSTSGLARRAHAVGAGVSGRGCAERLARNVMRAISGAREVFDAAA